MDDRSQESQLNDLDDFCPDCERTRCICAGEDEAAHQRPTVDVPVRGNLL